MDLITVKRLLIIVVFIKNLKIKFLDVIDFGNSYDCYIDRRLTSCS